MGTDFIPFHKPIVTEKHIERVVNTLKSGWLTTAGACDALEHEFLAHVGGKYAVSVNSCTAALHLALEPYIDLAGNRREVITSPITFVSAVSMIEHSGGIPVFCDVRGSDLTIDPDKLEDLITNETVAIIATHFAGIPCQMDKIQQIANRHGLPVICDAAHAIETRYQFESDFEPRRSGELGDVNCYSFYANKNITSGEGGMMVFENDEMMAGYARRMRLHGMDKDAWKRYGPGGYKHWDVERPGWKYNMSDINAALVLGQLEDMNSWLHRRKTIAEFYDIAFKSDGRIQRLEIPQGAESAHHLYVIRIKNRDRAMARIQERGVGVGIHFRAVHLLKYWLAKGGLGYPGLEVATKASDEVLSLPIYPGLGIEQADRVVSTVRGVLDELEPRS